MLFKRIQRRHHILEVDDELHNQLASETGVAPTIIRSIASHLGTKILQRNRRLLQELIDKFEYDGDENVS